jgi:hypothetical protein
MYKESARHVSRSQAGALTKLSIFVTVHVKIGKLSTQNKKAALLLLIIEKQCSAYGAWSKHKRSQQ